MIKAVVFDCFGVLAEDGWSPFKRQYLAETDKALAVAKMGKEVDQGLRSYEDMIKETAIIAGIDEQIVRAAVEHRVPNKDLFTYIQEVLKPHYKIGLLSNASYNVLKYLFTPDQVKIFDASALSYEVGLVKPGTDMFHVISARLGVNLDECLLVDDQERHVVGAEVAGMKAIRYTSIGQLQKDLRNLLDLRKIPASSELFRSAKTDFSVVNVSTYTSPPDKIGFNSSEASSDRDEVLRKSSLL